MANLKQSKNLKKAADNSEHIACTTAIKTECKACTQNLAETKKSTKFSIAKLCFIFATLFVCLFGLSACTWVVKPSGSGTAEYDADGKLRIGGESVMLNSAPVTGQVDETTGSFSWLMSYYVNNPVNKDYSYSLEMDQLGYHNQSFMAPDGSDVEEGYVRFFSAGSHSHTYSDTNGNQHTSTFSVSSAGFYLLTINNNNVVATKVYTTLDSIGMVGAYNQSLTSGVTGGKYSANHFQEIVYPCYNVIIDGVLTQINVTVDYSKLKVAFGENNPIGLVDGATIGDAFKFTYRVGSSGNFEPCGAGMVSAYVGEDGCFYLRFNPNLGKGATTRTIRLQSITYEKMNNRENVAFRGNSTTNAPVSFRCYKLTFNSNNLNSVNSTFESLSYDADQFYFAEKVSAINTGAMGKSGKNTNGIPYYTSLTGYFVAGRVVQVSKYVTATGDYAMQPWTINGKSEYSVVFASTLPNDKLGNKIMFDLSMIIDDNHETTEQIYNSETATTISATSKSFGVAESKLVKGNIYSYLNANVNSTENSKLYGEQIEEFDIVPYTGAMACHAYKDTINVIATASTSASTFYGNTARVKNFTLSGTTYDGEKLQEAGNNARLNGYYIYVYQAADPNNPNPGSDNMLGYFEPQGLTAISYKFVPQNTTAHTDYMQKYGDVALVNYTGTNGQFGVTGLTYNCYIMFSKTSIDKNESDDTTSTNLYVFYSASMKKIDDQTNVLQVLKCDILYSDRAGNAVIATKLDATSKVEVNIYINNNTSDSVIGNIDEFSEISYQVLSTTTTTTDAFGYTYSSVIISVLLPSNYSLVGYNVESINSIGQVIYNKADQNAKSDYEYILLDIGYDGETRTNTYTYYGVQTDEIINTAEVSSDGTLNYLFYDGRPYQYTKKDSVAQDGKAAVNYYYQCSFKDENDVVNIFTLKQTDFADGTTTYTHYQYVTLNISDDDIENNVSDNGDNVVSVNNTITYGGVKFGGQNTLTTSNNISIKATAYSLDGLTYSRTDKQNVNLNVYAYYNVEAFLNNQTKRYEYYYTAPLGKQTLQLDDNGSTVSTKIEWYNSELAEQKDQDGNVISRSNIDSLIQSGKVMLGSQIIAAINAGKFSSNFAKVTNNGISLIADNYYFVEKLGEPVELLVSQYFATDATASQETSTMYAEYKKADNGLYIYSNQSYITDPFNKLKHYNTEGILGSYDATNSLDTSSSEYNQLGYNNYVRYNSNEHDKNTAHYTAVKSSKGVYIFSGDSYIFDENLTKIHYSYNKLVGGFVIDYTGDYLLTAYNATEHSGYTRYTQKTLNDNTFGEVIYYQEDAYGGYVFVADNNKKLDHYLMVENKNEGENGGFVMEQELKLYTDEYKGLAHYSRQFVYENVQQKATNYDFSILATLTGTSAGYVETYTAHLTYGLIGEGSNSYYAYTIGDTILQSSANSHFSGDNTIILYYGASAGAALSEVRFTPEAGNEQEQQKFIDQVKNNSIVANINAKELAGASGRYYIDSFTGVYFDILESANIGSDDNPISVPKYMYTNYQFTYYSNVTGATGTILVYADSDNNFYYALPSDDGVGYQTTTISNDKSYYDSYILGKMTSQDGYYGVLLRGKFMPVIKAEAGSYVFATSFTYDDAQFNAYVNRGYFAMEENTKDLSGEFVVMFYEALGTWENDTFDLTYYLSRSAVTQTNVNYDYFYTNGGNTTYVVPTIVTAIVEGSNNVVVRRAVLATNNSVDVDLLGKVVLGKTQNSIYPCFNYYQQSNDKAILVKDHTSTEGGDVYYYDIDYTTPEAAVQAFPGVKLLSGAPYANPIFYFQVKHKADEQAVVNFGLEIVDSYYIEIITSSVTSTTNNMIYDFDTATFKDTITNLTYGDHIDQLYYVYYADTLTKVTGYTQETIKYDQNTTASRIYSQDNKYVIPTKDGKPMYYFEGDPSSLADGVIAVAAYMSVLQDGGTYSEQYVNITAQSGYAYYLDGSSWNKVQTNSTNTVYAAKFGTSIFVYQYNELGNVEAIYEYTWGRPNYQNTNGWYLTKQYTPYLAGTAITIQNVGLNEYDQNGKPDYTVYTTVRAESVYTQPIYHVVNNKPVILETIKRDNEGNPTDNSNLVIWQSSSTYIEDVPTFDVHSYYVAENGMIVLSSDSQLNEICDKVDNLFTSGAGGALTDYDYSNVLVGGVTTAYRVNATDININSYDSLQAYWKDSAINISNMFNSTDPYFLTSKEGAVLIAQPNVVLKDVGDGDVMYMFRQWLVFSRYNSSILYYNKAATESLADRYNSLCRFVSSEAGYYVFLPVYERVYSVGVGSSIDEGAKNLGGGVRISYADGESIDMENSYYGENQDEVYFVELLKTQAEGSIGGNYYYKNLKITPVIYYTGVNKVYNNQGSDKFYPEFKVRDDIFSITYTKNGKTYKDYFEIFYNSTTATLQARKLDVVSSFNSGTPGVVEVYANQGQYYFHYGEETLNQNKISGGLQQSNYSHLEKLPWQAEGATVTDLFSYTYSVKFFNDGALNGGNNTNITYSKVVYHDNSTGKYYAIDLFKLKQAGTTENPADIYKTSIVKLKPNQVIDLDNPDNKTNAKDFFLGASLNADYFANDKVEKFNALNTKTGYYSDSEGDVRYRFNSGNDLTSGELYYDADGNINVMQQFKTSYFTRDSKLRLQPVAQVGYRLENWYLSTYNQATNSWITSKKPIQEELGLTYDSIIRNVSYNNNDQNWYYVTEYFTTIGNGENSFTYYFYDAEKTAPALVPNNMLNDVVGYYYQYEEAGVTFWKQVYRAGATARDWYLDEALTQPCPVDSSAIVRKSHYSAITTIAAANSGAQDSYYIGSDLIYKDSATGNFYRSIDNGNITISGSRVYVQNLHSNIRIVANFIEVYQTMIFAEDSSQDNIEIVSVYYNNNQADNTDGVRSDALGNKIETVNASELDASSQGDYHHTQYNISSQDYDFKVGNISKYDFYYNQGTNPTSDNYCLADNYWAARQNLRDYIGYDQFATLTGENNNLIRVRQFDQSGTEALNLTNMYFDVYNSVYVVLRVYNTQTLNIHALGMNPNYTITPVFYPTESYAKQITGSEEIKYLYYIFKVTFDRNLADYYGESTITNKEGNYTYTTTGEGNYNSEYVVHVNRGVSLVNDAISGDYTAFYANLFSFKDNLGNRFEAQYDFQIVTKTAAQSRAAGDTIVGNSNKAIKLSGDLLQNIKTKLVNTYNLSYNVLSADDKLTTDYNWQSLKQFANYIQDTYNVDYHFAGVKTLGSFDDYTANYSQIIAHINNYFSLRERTTPQISGSINFINLSTIPVYTYSVGMRVITDTNVTSNGMEFDANALAKITGTTFTQNNIPDSNLSGEQNAEAKGLGIDISSTLYTRGGYKGHTYIGAGTGSDTAIEIMGSNYTNSFVDCQFDNTDFALARDTIMALEGLNVGESNSYWHCDNNVWYVQWVENGFTYKYIFLGWYEQKNQIVDGQRTWQDLQLMSTQPNRSFTSVANADTNIIALFGKATEVTISAVKDSYSLNINSVGDALNNPIYSTTNSEQNTKSYSGLFTAGTNFALAITPAGTYRLDKNWTFTTATGKQVNLDISSNSLFTFSQNGKKVRYSELILSDALTINFNLTQLLHVIYRGEVDKFEYNDTLQDFTSSLKIDMSFKEYVATVFNIEGYLYNDNDRAKNSGYEFRLLEVLGDAIGGYTGHKVYTLTHYNEATGNVENAAASINSPVKDSAQREIQFRLNGNNLTIYGYFDAELSGRLFLQTIQTNPNSSDADTIYAWNVNSFNQLTDKSEGNLGFYNYSSIDDIKAVFGLTDSAADKNKATDLYEKLFQFSKDQFGPQDINTFHMYFKYSNNLTTGDLTATGTDGVTKFDADGLNNSFILSQDAHAYLLEARIIKRSSVNIAYATINSLDNLSSTVTLDTTNPHPNVKLIDKNGELAWTGMSYKYSGGTYVQDQPNGTLTFDKNNSVQELMFTGNTKLTLHNLQDYAEGDDGTIYQFIGWFSFADGYLISKTTYSTLALESSGGYYVAVFAKTAKIEQIVTQYPEGTLNVAATQAEFTYSVDTPLANGNVVIQNLPNTMYIGDIMYAVIGSTLSMQVQANTGYIIADVTATTAAGNTSILQSAYIDSTTAPVELVVADTTYTSIFATFSLGYFVRVQQIYYTSIATNGLGQTYTGENFAYIINQDTGNSLASTDGGIITYTYAYGKRIVLQFKPNKLNTYGLIGFYINGEAIKGTYNRATQTFTTEEIEVTSHITVEARFTNYVSVKLQTTEAGNPTDSSIDYDTLFSYVHISNGITYNITANQTTTNGSDAERTANGFYVLSGTTLTMRTSTTRTDSAFSNWTWTNSPNGRDDVVSTTPVYVQAVESPATHSAGSAASVSFEFSANYKSCRVVTIEKKLSSYNQQDKDYLVEKDAAGSTLGTFTPTSQFWSLLDVNIQYTDKDGNIQVVQMGSLNSITIEVSTKSNLKITSNISAMIADRYSYTIHLNNQSSSKYNSLNNSNKVCEQYIEDACKYTINFAATRTLTAYLKVNNLQTSPSQINNELQIRYVLDGGGNNSITGNQSSMIVTYRSADKITLYAKYHADYVFAGFYINGVAFGTGDAVTYQNTNYYTIDISTGNASSSDGKTYYTTDTDISVDCLYYRRATVVASIALNGLTDYTTLENNLYFVMLGNRITSLTQNAGEFGENYNTAVQATTIHMRDNGSYHYYLSNANIALTAAAYQGFQFEGFYYKIDNGEWIKLPINTLPNGNYTFGDSLSSIINSSLVVANSTIYIQARYLRSNNVSVNVSYINSHNSDNSTSLTNSSVVNTTIDYAKVAYDNGKYVIIDNNNYMPLTEGSLNKYTNSTQFFFDLSKLVAFRIVNNGNFDNYSIYNIYVNGKVYTGEFVTVSAAELGINNDQLETYVILNLEDFVGEVSSLNANTRYSDAVIEVRMVEMVDLSVTTGVFETENLDKIRELGVDLSNLAITINYTPSYWRATYGKLFALSSNQGYSNIDSTGTYRLIYSLEGGTARLQKLDLSTGTYVDDAIDGNSAISMLDGNLFINIRLPIGSIVDVSLTDKDGNALPANPQLQGNENHTYYYNGWFAYNTRDLVGSRSVINYTTQVDYYLVQTTRLVARFDRTNWAYTYDTQYSYQFNGFNVGGQLTLAPVTTSEAENNGIAEALSQLLKNTAYSAYNINFTYTYESDANNSVTITITGIDNNLYNVEYTTKVNNLTVNHGNYTYAFMGWYQEVRDNNTQTSRLNMLASQYLGLNYGANGMPNSLKNATSLTAIFTQVITIDLTQDIDNTIFYNRLYNLSNTMMLADLIKGDGNGNYSVLGSSSAAATIDQSGRLVVTTLYTSFIGAFGQIAYGYYDQANIGSQFDNSDSSVIGSKYSVATSVGTSTANGSYLDETTTDANIMILTTSAIKHITGTTLTSKNVVNRTIYKYSVKTTDNLLVSINATATRAKNDDGTSAVDTTSTGTNNKHFGTLSLEANGKNFATTAGNFNDNNFTGNNSASNSEFEIDSAPNNNDLYVYVGGVLDAPNGRNSGVEFVLTIREPNGKVTTLVLNKDNLNSFIPFVNRFPLGTRITAAVVNTTNNEVLQNVDLYMFATPYEFAAFINSAATMDLTGIDYLKYPLSGTDQNIVGVDTTLTNGNKYCYLAFVASFYTIYGVKVDQNELDQGNVSIKYNTPTGAATTTSNYTIQIDTYPNYAFNNLFIYQDAQQALSQADLFAMIAALDGNLSSGKSNLADIIQAIIANGQNITSNISEALNSDFWHSVSFDSSTKLFTIASYDDEIVFSVRFTFFSQTSGGSKDYLGRDYITSATFNIDINSNITISTEYLHVVTTNVIATTELFDSSVGSYKTTHQDTIGKLFVYDYQFFTIEDGLYAIINKLNDAKALALATPSSPIYGSTAHFINYFYANDRLAKTGSEFAGDDGGILVIKGDGNGNLQDGEIASNNITLSMTFVGSVTLAFGTTIDYFNPIGKDLLGGSDVDGYNVDRLNTPFEGVLRQNSIIVNTDANDGVTFRYDSTKEHIGIGLTHTINTIDVQTILNASSTMALADSYGYFAFDRWVIVLKLDDGSELTLLEVQDTELTFDHALLINICEAIKAIYGEDYSIDLSKIVVYGNLKEEALTTTIDYLTPDENFALVWNMADSGSTKTGTIPVDFSTKNTVTTQVDANTTSTLYYKWGFADMANSTTSYRLAYYKYEYTLQNNNQVTQQMKVVIAHSKHLPAQLSEASYGFSYNIVANNYSSQESNNHVARKDIIGTNSYVRAICPDNTINPDTNVNMQLSNTSYLLLNGVLDSAGGLITCSPLTGNNLLSSLLTISGNVGGITVESENLDSSANFTLNTTDLNLVELGIATDDAYSSSNNAVLQLAVTSLAPNGTISSNLLSLDRTNSGYAAISVLVKQGTMLKVGLQINGSVMNANYNGLAISHTLMVSDLYNHFAAKGLSDVSDVELQNWRDALGMQGSTADNKYYSTLYQYSHNTITKDFTSYVFIASQNTSLIADFINLFADQRLYITGIFNADSSFEYQFKGQDTPGVNSSIKQITGDNFVITIAPSGTELEFTYKPNESFDTTDQFITYITNKDNFNADSISNTGHNLTITQGEYQLNLGVVSNKYVDTYIWTASNYTKLDSKNNLTTNGSVGVEKVKDLPTDQDVILAALTYGLNLTLNDGKVINHAYISNSNSITEAIEQASITDKFAGDFAIVDSVTGATINNAKHLSSSRGSTAYLVAKKLDGYIFNGFYAVGNGTNLNLSISAQNISNFCNGYTLKYLGGSQYNNGQQDLLVGQRDGYYYLADVVLDGNSNIIAMYTPVSHLINLVYREFNEDAGQFNSAGQFIPSSADKITTQGKVKTESLVVSTDTPPIRLQISSNGFSEFKGLAIQDVISPTGSVITPTIRAIYSTRDIKEVSLDSDTPVSVGSDYSKIFSAYQSSINDIDLHSLDKQVDNVTLGALHADRLFVSRYSVKGDDGITTQNKDSLSYVYLQTGGQTQDITMYAYFTTMYYTLNLELAELESGFTNTEVYKNGGNGANSNRESQTGGDTYVAYKIANDPEFVNPSANAAYGISEKDPYIYTWFDCEGHKLANPVKLTASMVLVENDGYVKLVRNPSTDNDYRDAYVITTPNYKDGFGEHEIPTNLVAENSNYEWWHFVEQNGGLVEASNYTDRYYRYNLDNIYSYIIPVKNYNQSTTWKLANGLFEISINNQAFDSGSIATNANMKVTDSMIIFRDCRIAGISNIIIDVYVRTGAGTSNNDLTIYLNARIFADSVTQALPIVKVTMSPQIAQNSDQTLASVQPYKLDYMQLNYTDDSKTTTTLTEFTEENNIHSTNLDLSKIFFQNILTLDEETGAIYLASKTDEDTEAEVATLSKTLRLSYILLSKNVTATVQVGTSTPIEGSNDRTFNSYGNDIELISERPDANLNLLKSYGKYYHDQTHPTNDKCGLSDRFCNDGNHVNSDHIHDLITSYNLYIIQNAQVYIDALESCINTGRNDIILKYIGALLAFNPSGNLKEANVENYGDAFDYLGSGLSRQKFANLLDGLGYTNLRNRLLDKNCTDLMFRRVDVFTNFVNGVHVNYYANTLNYGDLAVSVCQLAEHSYPHDVSGHIWKEYRGYDYVPHTTTTYLNISQDSSYSTKYDNNYSKTDEFKSIEENISLSQAVRNYSAGIWNRDAKFLGTYSYYTHASVMPYAGDYADSTTKSFNCVNTIDLTKELHVYTRNHDKHHTTWSDALVVIATVVIVTAAVIAIPVTGGASSGAIALTAIGAGAVAIGVTATLINEAIKGDAPGYFNFAAKLDFSTNTNRRASFEYRQSNN